MQIRQTQYEADEDNAWPTIMCMTDYYVRSFIKSVNMTRASSSPSDSTNTLDDDDNNDDNAQNMHGYEKTETEMRTEATLSYSVCPDFALWEEQNCDSQRRITPEYPSLCCTDIPRGRMTKNSAGDG